MFDVRQFGAVGDGQTLDTAAFVAATCACREAGGGVILVPPGVYLLGIFEIYGHTTLRLEGGATLLSSPQLEDHRVEDKLGGLFFARDADGITLEGAGVIDGNAPTFFQEDKLHWLADFDAARTRQGPDFGDDTAMHGPLEPRGGRPGNLVVLAGCTNVRITGLRMTGSPYWTLHLADCADVSIQDLTIVNDPRHPNNDGIHLTTCRRVLIEDCLIIAGDDAIAVTGFNDPGHEKEIALGLRKLAGASEDITIRRCRLSSRSTAMRIGYGRNPTRRIMIEDLECFDSNRGIGIFAREALVEDVTIRNARVQTRLFHGNWWGKAEPLHLSAVRFPGQGELCAVRRVTVEKLAAVAENCICLYGEEPGTVEDVFLSDVTLDLRRSPLHETWGGNLDLRPAADNGIAMHAGGHAPLWALNVRNLKLRRFRAVIAPSATDIFQDGMHLAGCSGFEAEPPTN